MDTIFMAVWLLGAVIVAAIILWGFRGNQKDEAAQSYQEKDFF